MELSKLEEAMVPQNGAESEGNAEGDKMPQYLVTLAATSLVFAGGAVIGWSAPALPMLENTNSTLPFHTSADESSWIGSLLAIGALIGAFPAGSLADTMGRKMSILSLAAPLLLSWGIIFFAGSAMMLFAARLIAGIGLGAICTIVPMYIAEIAEDSVRGALGASFPLLLNTGICYTYIFGAFISYYNLIIACAISPIISFLIFVRAPETPLYLLRKGDRAEAERSLRRLRGPKYNAYKELQALEEELAEQEKLNVPFMKVACTPQGKRSITISLGLMAWQQLSGINIIVFFAGSIFQEAGSSLDSEIVVILIGITMIVVGLVNLYTIERAGRKVLLQASSILMTLALMALGYYFLKKERGDDLTSIQSMPVIAVIFYMVAFSLGFSPVPWMISGEVLPQEIKAVTTGIATGVNWALAFLVTKAFKPIMDAVGPAYTYWLLAFLCALAFLFSTFVVIETKGKSLSRIQDELTGHKPTPTDERKS